MPRKQRQSVSRQSSSNAWLLKHVKDRKTFGERSNEDGRYKKLLDVFTSGARQRKKYGSVLSLLSALLALFRCACVSSFSIWVQFFWVDCDFSSHDAHQKRQKRIKNKNSWRYILSCCLLNHSLCLLQHNKKWFELYIFFNYLCNFLYSVLNSVN